MLTFTDAHDTDLAALQAMHAGAADALTARFGQGRWSRDGFVKRIDVIPGRSRVRVGWFDGTIVSSLRLQTKKPWAIDTAYFTPAKRPLYLTGMVVLVSHQGRGIGRTALDDARTIAQEWGADAIRLDAYNAPAGAGGFYHRCGFERRGHVVYRGNPLTYHELLLD